mmetsp:Transcript_13548/g.33191  ORF Transcript_13548/g.33191 Transcript_13548/m.33191 type:complete len:201 (+) Transcript_13548:240-842(+)
MGMRGFASCTHTTSRGGWKACCLCTRSARGPSTPPSSRPSRAPPPTPTSSSRACGRAPTCASTSRGGSLRSPMGRSRSSTSARLGGQGSSSACPSACPRSHLLCTARASRSTWASGGPPPCLVTAGSAGTRGPWRSAPTPRTARSRQWPRESSAGSRPHPPPRGRGLGAPGRRGLIMLWLRALLRGTILLRRWMRMRRRA